MKTLPQYRPFRQAAKRHHPPVVTIAIGFTCKRAIVFASDSQMSVGGDTYKQYGEEKLFALEFADGSSAMIAIAGSLDAANLFRETLERSAKGLGVSDAQDIPRCVEAALKDTRRRLLDYLEDDATEDQKRQHLLDMQFAVLLGFWFETKPYIYESGLFHGRTILCRRPFAATGCGANVAGYILTGGDYAHYETERAHGLAVYAVEMCKEFDNACGGDTRVMSVESGGRPERMSALKVRVYVAAVNQVRKTMQGELAASITKQMAEVYWQLATTSSSSSPTAPERLSGQ